jgi:hypothetical protein
MLIHNNWKKTVLEPQYSQTYDFLHPSSSKNISPSVNVAAELKQFNFNDEPAKLNRDVALRAL